jgi:hypothetical protein
MMRAYASPYRLAREARGRPTASHGLSDAAHQRMPSAMTSAVSPKRSHSDCADGATSVHPRCSEAVYYATSVHTIKLRDHNDSWGCAVVVNLTEGVGDSGSERQARRAGYGEV